MPHKDPNARAAYQAAYAKANRQRLRAIKRRYAEAKDEWRAGA